MRIQGGVEQEELDRIEDAYFEWMIHLVCSGKYARKKSFRKLFRLLHKTEFIYILESIFVIGSPMNPITMQRWWKKP